MIKNGRDTTGKVSLVIREREARDYFVENNYKFDKKKL